MKNEEKITRTLFGVYFVLVVIYIIVFSIGCIQKNPVIYEQPAPLPTVPVITPVNGLQCNLYDMSLSPPSYVPNFNATGSQTLQNGQQPAGIPVATFVVTGPVDFINQAEMLAGSGFSFQTNYALDCKGNFTVSSPEVYQFYLNSDDGSYLIIDGYPVVQNDGLHGAISKNGDLALSGGEHTAEIQYFQGPGQAVLQLFSNIDITFHQ